MARTATLLTFTGQAEQAFLFYRKVFGTEFVGGIRRMSDYNNPNMPPPNLTAEAARHVLHVELPITGGHALMGLDVAEVHAEDLKGDQHVALWIEPDTRAEAKRLFAALSEGGEVIEAMDDAWWGTYRGLLTDRFGVTWALNCKASA